MFKAGDIVVGLPNSHYRITGAGSISKVIEVFNEYTMEVEIIKTGSPLVLKELGNTYVGNIYRVQCNKFVLEKGNTNQIVTGLLHKGDVFQ